MRKKKKRNDTYSIHPFDCHVLIDLLSFILFKYTFGDILFYLFFLRIIFNTIYFDRLQFTMENAFSYTYIYYISKQEEEKKQSQNLRIIISTAGYPSRIFPKNKCVVYFHLSHFLSLYDVRTCYLSHFNVIYYNFFFHVSLISINC